MKTCGQTELPDKSILLGQKLSEKSKWDICRDFQTTWVILFFSNWDTNLVIAFLDKHFQSCCTFGFFCTCVHVYPPLFLEIQAVLKSRSLNFGMSHKWHPNDPNESHNDRMTQKLLQQFWICGRTEVHESLNVQTINALLWRKKMHEIRYWGTMESRETRTTNSLMKKSGNTVKKLNFQFSHQKYFHSNQKIQIFLIWILRQNFTSNF